MSGIGFIKTLAADIPTPATDKVVLFVEDTTGDPSIKDDTGTVTSLVGIPGQGVPTGGTAGQVLEKIDGVDYNTQWATPSSGFTNPMTTAGDIIYGGVSGAATRLAAGTNGHVLTMVAGDPAWQPASGGAYTGTAGRINITGSVINIDTSYVGQASITTLGTIATGVWNATAIGATYGGTGQTTYTIGDILYASGTSALSKLAAGTATHVLTSNGAGVAPSWQVVSGGGGGLTNWTEALNTAAPNATVNVTSFVPSSASTNVATAIVPKGSAGFGLSIPTGTVAGGPAWGVYALNLQLLRGGAGQGPSGSQSVVLGTSNTASGNSSHAYGTSSSASATNAHAIGASANATADRAFAIGTSATTASGVQALAFMGATADGEDSLAWNIGAATRGVKNMRSWGVYALSANNQLTLVRSTSNTTPAVMSSNGLSASSTNQFRMSNNNNISQGFWGYVVARQTGTGSPQAMWKFEGMMTRDGGTTSLVGTVTPTLITSFGTITGWAVAVTTSGATNSLVVTVTGPAGATVNWTCEVQSTEASG